MRLLTHRTCVVILLCAAAPSLFAAEGTVVSHEMIGPSARQWVASPWTSASGRFGPVSDVPAELGDSVKTALEITIGYSGRGFQSYGVTPAGAMPGQLRKLSIWAKAVQPGYSWLVSFKDANGNGIVDGKKLEWGLKTEPGKWTRSEFTIPAQWSQPVRVASLSGHNWSQQSAKADAVLRVCDFRVEVDISTAKDANSLVTVEAGTGVESNVFAGDEPARYLLTIDSWLGKEISGSLAYAIRDAEGAQLVRKESRISFNQTHEQPVEFSPPKRGVYEIAFDLKLSTGTEFSKRSRFACVPKPHEYTVQEKLASPYGLNIHGGAPGVAYKGIARMGFTWIRDYAYNKEWMVRARGEDGRYAGWPFYPGMDRNVLDSGLMLLPCLGGSIKSGVKDGKLQPDRQWTSDLMHILISFPQYPAWELDNEYDYGNGREEAARGWSSYDAYHKVFGQAVKLLDGKTLAVQQGTAGVHPEWVRRGVRNGSLDNIDVVNGHFYCGVSAPELSTGSTNVGEEGAPPSMLFDDLRDFVEAANSDGKPRQTWITEFGWDTLVGHVVSEREQAAYLQRGYLLGLQAGLDKMFWYWHRDTKAKPTTFFDGCGVLDPRDEPKPAAAAIAALAHFLKHPKPVGTFDLGPGTFGHVFRDGDTLVACAFKLAKDGPRTVAEFPNGKLYGMYSDPLAPTKQELDVTPVWIVGIPETDPMYLQTAYELKSRQLVRAAAGDTLPVELRVRNNRKTALSAAFTVQAPEGWAAEPATQNVSVPAGSTQVFPVRVKLPPAEKAGTREVRITVAEGNLRKALTTTVMTVPAAEVTVQPLTGEPGRTKIQATVTSNSFQATSIVLTAEAPKSWKVQPDRVELKDIPSRQTRTVTFDVTWDTNWTKDEKARIAVLDSAGEKLAETGIIPGAIRIPRAGDMKLDGDLTDWPADSRVPDWALGKVGSAAAAEVHMAYSDEGLHLAFKVGNSKVTVTDPKAFWSQDCVEVFIDTQNDKKERKGYSATDHQFWFCPMVQEKRAYAGQWKRGSEIAETLYDIPGVKSFCGRTADGYVMEILLPASRIKGFAAKAGRKLGLNLNISVPTQTGRNEISWPRPKGEEIFTRQHLWGVVELK